MALYLLIIAAAVFLGGLRPAHAYLDPGSGSFVIQMILGAVLGGLVAFKVFFRKIRTFAGRMLSRLRRGEKNK